MGCGFILPKRRKLFPKGIIPAAGGREEAWRMTKTALPHRHGEGQNEEYLKNQLSKPETFEAVADIFKLLDDTSRVRIFWLLCHCEECVINISAMVDMTSPAVSHHLRQLKAGGLIVSRRDGKEVYYKAADTEQSRLLHQAIENTMEISCPQKRSSGSYPAGQTAIIREMHEYLLQHIDQRITIEELSQRYLMNATTLKTVFKEVYGESLASHMKAHRMERAAALLGGTTDSIAQIAKAVGYTSQSRFSAAFKEVYQMLPLEYRRMNKQVPSIEK